MYVLFTTGMLLGLTFIAAHLYSMVIGSRLVSYLKDNHPERWDELHHKSFFGFNRTTVKKYIESPIDDEIAKIKVLKTKCRISLKIALYGMLLFNIILVLLLIFYT